MRGRLLQEAVRSLADVKLARAETRVLADADRLSQLVAEGESRMRVWTQAAQQLAATASRAISTLVPVIGALLVINGGMTAGSLIAASILAG